MVDIADYQWVRKFDPNKRLFVGRIFRKKSMDLTIVFLPPILDTSAGFDRLTIFISSPGAPIIYTNKRAGAAENCFCSINFAPWCRTPSIKETYRHLK